MSNRRSNRSAFPLAVAGVVAGFAASPLVVAQEPLDAEQAERIVVTATRTEEKLEDVASSVTVITAEDMEASQVRTVYDALREVPALSLVRTGPSGGAVSVFMRGANSGHTLVLVDGIEVNDPVTTGRLADIAHLTVDGIERIEVVRGSQSTLYGSDAIGGVINIITKKGTGDPKGFASVESGSFDTFRASAGAGGKSGAVDFSVLGSSTRTAGISAAPDGAEKDGYTNTTLSARLGVNPSDTFGLDVLVRHVDSSVEADVIDDILGVPEDDPNNVLNTRQLLAAARAWFAPIDGSWKSNLRFSLNDIRRDNTDDPDADHPDVLGRSLFEGQSLKCEWQSDLRLGETGLVTVGIETEQEEGSSSRYSESRYGPYESRFEKKSASTTSLFAQASLSRRDYVAAGDRLNATFGIRADDHNMFGTSGTGRITASYAFLEGRTKLKGTYGTGFKAPSLYQLYDASNGNPDLSPEESTSWDVGFEQKLPGEKGTVSAVWFRTDFVNLIDWFEIDPVLYLGEYRNIGEAEAEGMEFVASFSAGGFSLNASYTYTRTQDNVTGLDLLRRPQSKYGLGVTHRFGDRGSVSLAAVYVSDRWDEVWVWDAVGFEYRPERRILEQYMLLNLSADFDVTERLSVFGRIENLFDEEYEEVYGYGTPGFSVHIGGKATF